MILYNMGEVCVCGTDDSLFFLLLSAEEGHTLIHYSLPLFSPFLLSSLPLTFFFSFIHIHFLNYFIRPLTIDFSLFSSLVCFLVNRRNTQALFSLLSCRGFLRHFFSRSFRSRRRKLRVPRFVDSSSILNSLD